MTNTFAKVALLGAVTALAGCSCLRSPDLDVAPVAASSAYGDTSYSTGTSTRTTRANATDVQERFQNDFVAGGLNMVFFDFDSAAITPQAEARLNQFAQFAMANNVQGVTIEGHADERGTREYNLALGDRRAVAIKRYLVGAGMEPNNLTTISYGKERPMVDGHDETSWAKNRRGVLVLQ